MYRFYIGTYTARSGSKGIYTAEFDPALGAMRIVGETVSSNPSFAAINKAGTRLYTVNEKPGAHGDASSYAIDRGTGGLSFLGMVAAGGASPCYIGLDPSERAAIVTNYSSGSVSIFPLDDDGALSQASHTVTHEGKSVNEGRQAQAHAHSFIIDAAGRVIVADLGMDKLMVYDIDHSGSRPSLAFRTAVDAPPGAGPRHMAFDAGYRRLYVVGELDSSVNAYDYDKASGGLSLFQSVSSLPPGFGGKNIGADIHMSADGRFLYSSNRGEDSIAVFSVDVGSGALTFVATQPTFGRTPRNFAIDPSGRWLLAANQDTDNIVSFRLDPLSGLLEKASEVSVPTPVMILFAV